MPLIKATLELGIKTDIESALKIEFQKQGFIDALKKHLDGGALAGLNSGAKDLKKAFKNIKSKTEPILNNTPDIAGAPAVSEDIVTRVTANELANGISEGICKWMSDEWAKVIAEKIAKAVATNVDTFVKSATIIVPPGQAVATSSGAGATSSPAPPASIS